MDEPIGPASAPPAWCVNTGFCTLRVMLWYCPNAVFWNPGSESVASRLGRRRRSLLGRSLLGRLPELRLLWEPPAAAALAPQFHPDPGVALLGFLRSCSARGGG